jgi:glyoxylase-like metal-dependent hydrolase (beta-lactamase superfamily II)
LDHVLGNSVARADTPQARLLAHEETTAALPGAMARLHEDTADEGIDDEHRSEVLGSPVLVPEESFTSVLALDLGGRYVEVVHCGRGHTAGDAVVLVPDADVLVAGDLVEEGSHPGYGVDCWPLEWPATLEVLAQLTTPRTLVVPGHGAPVGQEFVQDQRHDVGRVAETIRDLAAQGARLDDVLAHVDWPYPRDVLEHAVRRGYEHLPPTARRLPMA